MIAAKDAAWSGGALYFREFEYLEASGGAPRALVRSPYAKLTDGKVLLVCVERDRPAKVYKPSWETGPCLRAPPASWSFPLASEPVYRALSARAAPSTLSLREAWRAVGEAKSFGIDSGTVIVDELLARSALPFGIFTASALGALDRRAFPAAEAAPSPRGFMPSRPSWRRLSFPSSSSRGGSTC